MRVRVNLPGGTYLHTIKGTSGDKFEFKAPRSGMYKFCFHNPYTTPDRLLLHTRWPYSLTIMTLPKMNIWTRSMLKIAELREALESVTAEQKYLKALEIRHRHTNESTGNRVILYTTAEYILLALASGLQVVYIRRLFDKSIAYNRV